MAPKSVERDWGMRDVVIADITFHNFNFYAGFAFTTGKC